MKKPTNYFTLLAGILCVYKYCIVLNTYVDIGREHRTRLRHRRSHRTNYTTDDDLCSAG